jgi:hypothetical protein
VRRRTVTTPSVEELAQRGDVAGLVRAVADRDEGSRAAALDALAERRDPEAPLRLADALLNRPGQLEVADRDALRRLVGAAGGEKASTGTVAHLLSELGGARDTRAITMLVWLAPASVQPLIDVLDVPHRGLQAALALGYIRDRRAIEPLHELMLGSPDEHMRRAAAWSLGTLGDPAAANALLIAHHQAADQPPAAPEPVPQSDPDPEHDAVGDHDPPLSLEALGSLDLDGLAELYDLAAEAWRSADRNGNAKETERWRVVAEAIVHEARDRPGSDRTDQQPRPAGFLNRRRDRQRARLLEACMERAAGDAG